MFEKFTSLSHLYNSYYLAHKGRKKTQEVIKYKQNLEINELFRRNPIFYLLDGIIREEAEASGVDCKSNVEMHNNFIFLGHNVSSIMPHVPCMWGYSTLCPFCRGSRTSSRSSED